MNLLKVIEKIMKILINWIVAAIVILIAAYLVPGVAVTSFWIALIAALVFGIVNAFVKPIVGALTLPINIITLGLFTLVINALLALLVAFLVPGFTITGFWVALIFAVILVLINWAVEKVF